MIKTVKFDDEILINEIESIFYEVYTQKNELKNEFKAGDEVTLNISRNGTDMDIPVVLQEVTQGDILFENQEAVEN